MALPGKYIEELTELTVLNGTEEVPASKTGATEDYKFTLTRFKNWFLSLTGLSFKENVTFEKQIVSTIAQGTAPISVVSTTKVTNLQADSVDGIGISSATAGYFPVVSGTNYTDSIMSQSGASIVQNGQGSYIFSDGGVGTHSIRGVGAGGTIQFKYDTGTTDRYLRLGMQDNSAVFTSVINIHNNQNVGIGFTTTPNEKIESSANIRANGDFKKNEFFVTRGIAANVNITTTSTTNVQANNANDYVFTLSAAVTATLNFNDAAYQANSIINFEITGGTAVKFTKSGGTFYQNGVALVSDTYSGYDGTKINFISVRVISATKFEIV